jgi:ABC-type lipoprotein export system ATPase subunit
MSPPGVKYTFSKKVCMPCAAGHWRLFAIAISDLSSSSITCCRNSALLKVLGVGHRVENKPGALSGGEAQRVAVARALINHPDIVFADEPTGNLDTANAKELHRLFFDLRDRFKQTFLIVTHNEELARMSDRVLHMKDGIIVSN